MNRRLKGLSVFALGAGLFFGTILLLVAFVAFGSQKYARVSFSKTYYFLVKRCEETAVAVVSGDVYSSGGAGYYLQGENAVALACYFKETSALSVQRSLEAKGTETELIERTPEELVLRGRKCAYKEQILSSLETVDQLAHILYDTANGLERSELTQSEAKTALKGVISSLRGLQEGNADDVFTSWNMGLREAERRAAELSEGLLFAKDFRYLQTMLCDKTVRLTNYFS